MEIQEFYRRFNNEEIDTLVGVLQSIRSERKSEFPMSVFDSDVSVRCLNFMKGKDFKYWYQLSELTSKKFYRLRGMGKKTLVEVREQMSLRNLKFANEK